MVTISEKIHLRNQYNHNTRLNNNVKELALESEPIQIKLVLSESAAVYADTLPIPVANLSRSGWKWTKSSAGVEKFNYYFYSNQANNPMTVVELKTFWACVSINTFTDINSVPFLVLYTAPTGINDAAFWYHSKICYAIELSGQYLYSGEKIVIYTGKRPIYLDKLRAFKLTYIIKTGEANPNEVVNTLSVHSASQSAVDCQIVTHQVGWTNNQVAMNIALI